jgi:hypothetical protein
MYANAVLFRMAVFERTDAALLFWDLWSVPEQFTTHIQNLISRNMESMPMPLLISAAIHSSLGSSMNNVLTDHMQLHLLVCGTRMRQLSNKHIAKLIPQTKSCF